MRSKFSKITPRTDNERNLYNDLLCIPYVRGGRNLRVDGGFDCYGLVAELYRRMGIVIPNIPKVWKGEDCESVAFANRPFWKPVLPIQGDTQDLIVASCDPNAEYPHYVLRPMTTVHLKVKGHACHIGLVLANNRFIHTWQGSNMVVVEKFSSPVWKNKIMGVYRP